MPKWGLVPSGESTARPWGIEPKWLQADKANTDPIQDRIYLNVLERRIVDSKAYQRLRRLRQLGTTHLVYPGATHSRFAHSLGTLRVTQDILDELFENPVTARRRDSLLTQWEDSLPDVEIYERKLEVQVLARLGALMHDFCHVPFGHTIEDDYGLLLPHDKNSDRFDHLWGQLDPDVREAIGSDLKAQLKHLILPRMSHDSKSKYPFVEDIVGNTICADLIDYLARDFYNTGLPAGLGVHFLTYFFVTRDDDKDMPQRLALRLTKADRTRGNRPDVVSEVMKYLRHRYELGERVIEHHTHVSADAMLGRAFEFLKDLVKEERLEEILRTNGEDGLLERIAADDSASWLETYTDPATKTRTGKGAGGSIAEKVAYKGLRDLVSGVLHRQLHQPVALTKDQAVSGRLHGRYGSDYDDAKHAKERHAVEAEAARVARLKNPWDVLITVPSPKMRFKPAQVLVEVNGTTSTLVDSMLGETARDLEKMHAGLWAVRVLVARYATEEQKDIVRAFVAHELGVEWAGLQEIGDDYVKVVVRQFIESRPNAGNLPRQIEAQLLNACRAARAPNMKPRTATEIRGVCEAILATLQREGKPSVLRPENDA